MGASPRPTVHVASSSSTFSSLIFMSSGPCPPCHFRSFATRRSSDLNARRQHHRFILRLVVIGHKVDRVLADIGQHLMRSEEHTSGLQSRGHIVCRLLLETNKRMTVIFCQLN